MDEPAAVDAAVWPPESSSSVGRGLEIKDEEGGECAFEEDYEGCFISLQRLSPPCAAGSNSPATTVGDGKTEKERRV